MKIDILTLFPKMFSGPFEESIIKRAQDKNLVQVRVNDLRQWGLDKRRTVDDRPYGGGVGMVLMVEPIYNALEKLKSKDSKVILLTPQGKTFNQALARSLSKEKHLILVAGHYEGFDERIRAHLVDEQISIGDYILTGGELPAMVVTDAIVRLVPGVLEKPEATESESFSLNTKYNIPNTSLEYPQYTRPENFKGWKVPEILLSGNHAEIEKWREQESRKKTRQKSSNPLKR